MFIVVGDEYKSLINRFDLNLAFGAYLFIAVGDGEYAAFVPRVSAIRPQHLGSNIYRLVDIWKPAGNRKCSASDRPTYVYRRARYMK